MAFKPVRPTSQTWPDPEALFRDLKSRKVEGLLSHQGEIIRSYTATGVSENDVGIQLPTGSGKTLVGLLIAEWRRRRFGERAVFLCPTNQLVHQVVAQAANKFGLRAAAFTGKKKAYDQKSKTAYQSGEIVAVTSYSALFNSDPFFSDPNVIVLDDAHTSAEYIASPWAVSIGRNAESEAALFEAIASVVSPLLDPISQARIRGEWRDSFDRSQVEMISAPKLSEAIPALRAVIDEHAGDIDKVYFPWEAVRDNLDACQFYFSSREISIRPLIPPTWTHEPFHQAKHRIYMSATFGESGDLERITGRRRIHRLEIPASYRMQGVGRRLFFFPERSIDRPSIEKLLELLIRRFGRALYILPNEARAAERRRWVQSTLGFAAFDARQIESDKLPFTSNAQAVAVVANRYDGIDLAGDECRLLIIEDMPQAMSLQEQFLVERMGAGALLNERISNRIVQAFGRCTRSDLDYALVIVIGNELAGRLFRAENRRALNPELQAELGFGIEQSKNTTIKDLTTNANAFLNQDDEWKGANEQIISLRGEMTQEIPTWTANLRNSVEHEVRYHEAMWRGDYEQAIDSAREVLAHLTSSELKGYRALWSYLAGNAAWRAAQAGVSGAERVARDYFRQAFKAALSVRWLGRLGRIAEDEKDAGDTAQRNWIDAQVERIESVFESLGTTHNRRYVAEEKEVLEGLSSSDGKIFETAQAKLGTMIGFEAGNKETSGAPDPWWLVDSTLCFVFEDYSEGKETSTLSVNKARQAASHPKWVRAKLPVRQDAEVLPVLVCGNVSIDQEARVHLGGVYHWPLHDFLKWAKTALAAIRELRATYPGRGDLAWRATAIERLQADQLDAGSVKGFIEASPAETMK